MGFLYYKNFTTSMIQILLKVLMCIINLANEESNIYDSCKWIFYTELNNENIWFNHSGNILFHMQEMSCFLFWYYSVSCPGKVLFFVLELFPVLYCVYCSTHSISGQKDQLDCMEINWEEDCIFLLYLQDFFGFMFNWRN